MYKRVKHLSRTVMASKLGQDMLWNYLSLAVLSLSGVLMNFIIAYFYPASVVGLFNLVISIYVIAAQFSTLGIHYSVLKHLSSHQREQRQFVLLLSSALLLVMIIAAILSLILFSAADFFGYFFHGKNVLIGVRWVAIALFFFSVNKVCLWALNGLRKMRWFAFFQAFRFVLLAGVIFIIAVNHWRIDWLFASFLIAELVLSLCFFFVIGRLLDWRFACSRAWLSEHYKFGLKGFCVGVSSEVNPRIGILVLGLFVSKAEVGIYSFASLFAEGLLALVSVIRNNINPLIASHYAEGRLAELGVVLKKVRLFAFGFIGVAGLAILIFFPLMIDWFLPDKRLLQGSLPLCILLVSIFITVAWQALNNFLTQCGRPDLQSLQGLIMILANVGLNFLLVPLWGVIGAALATSLASFFLGAWLLNWLVHRTFSFSLLRYNVTLQRSNRV